LMMKEIKYLGSLFVKPEKPVVAIIGGAKVKDKLPILKNIANHFDAFCIGGGMSYTFLAASGYKIGKSLFDEEHFHDAKQMLSDWKECNLNVLLPSDHIAASSIDSDIKDVKFIVGDIPDNFAGFDIGRNSATFFADTIKKAGTVLFNGPVGVFEKEAFSSGTKKVCEALAETNATTIVGGGDTVSAVEEFGVSDRINHISTGGGAALEFLEGKTLPGISALDNK